MDTLRILPPTPTPDLGDLTRRSGTRATGEQRGKGSSGKGLGGKETADGRANTHAIRGTGEAVGKKGRKEKEKEGRGEGRKGRRNKGSQLVSLV